MRLTIENKSKQESFVTIFQLLKNWTTTINIYFEKEKVFIQAMDKSHSCLANINLMSKWFTEYECSTANSISVDACQMAILMNYGLKHNTVELKFEDEIDPDKLYIHFYNGKEKKGTFEHFFELTLLNQVEGDILGIPEVDYDIDFTINSKKLVEMLSELSTCTLSSELNIICDEKMLELSAIGDLTKLKINIPAEELDEYAIAENDKLSMLFSLNHLCKTSCTVKLSDTICISLSKDYPMLLKYDLGDDSQVSFYIAPKISE